MPTCAGEQPWLVSQATVNDCGATMRAEAALRRPPLVVVQRVRVVHRLHPAPDVVEGDGLLQLAGLHGHAHVLVEVGGVEGGRSSRHRSPAVGVDGFGGEALRSTSATRASSRTLVSLLVIGISPSSKNRTRLGTL